MDKFELIGQVVCLYLRQQLQSNDIERSTSKFLLDCLTPTEIYEIAQCILVDSELKDKVDLKLPKHYLAGFDLPNSVLTQERTTYFRNASCSKEILLIATTGDDEQQSLKDITSIGSAQLMSEIDLWLLYLNKDLCLDEKFITWWKKALEGLFDVQNFSLNRFSSYMVDVAKFVKDEGLQIREALGRALPALRIPRDTLFFQNGLNEKNSTHKSRWKQLYSTVIKRSYYLAKQTPAQKLLTKEALQSSFAKVKEIIPDCHHQAIADFIKTDKQWDSSVEQLCDAEWEDIGPLFDKIKPEKYNLGKETLAFYDELEDGLITKDEHQYLTELSKRKKKLLDDDEEFYDLHWQELKEDPTLKKKWDQFVFGAPAECSDFLVGITQCLETFFGSSPSKSTKQINIRSDYRTKAELRKLNIVAGSYFATKYKGLQKLFGKNVNFDCKELFNFPELAKEWRNKQKSSKRKINTSTAKAALRLKFTLELVETSDQDDELKIATKQLVWQFNHESVIGEFYSDWQRLVENEPCLLSSCYRETISGKGALQNLDLRNASSLSASFARNKGSFIAAYKPMLDIFKIWDKNIKEVKSLKSISDDNMLELTKLWHNFKSSYTEAIIDFLDEGFSAPSIKEQSNDYTSLLNFICLHAKGDTNREYLLKPLLQIGVSQVLGGSTTVIVTPWHPLRMLATYAKAKQISELIKQLTSKNSAEIEDSRLFFKEIKSELQHPYYPEIVLGWEDKEPKLLSLTDSYQDYSLHELPVAADDGNDDTNESPLVTAKLVLDLLKRYLALYPHERANLSTVLFNCDSSKLPQAIVAEVSGLRDGDDDMRCEIVLRHRDQRKLSNIYEKIVSSEDDDIDQFVASEASVDFMARLRIGIMAEECTIDCDEEGKPKDIVFMQDVISRHSKVEWYQETATNLDVEVLIPSRWSRRRASAKDDRKSIVYLASPAQSTQGWTFITALTTFIKGDWDGVEEKRLLPVRQLDFNDSNTASIFNEVHKLGNWVVNYDELLDRRQLQNQNVNVIRYKQTTNQGRNLLISSTAPLGMLKSMLTRKVADLNLGVTNEESSLLVEKLINDANSISGDIVLRAAKRGRNASELIGVVLSKFLIEQETKSAKLKGWFFLDDYAEWLGQKEQQIADTLMLIPEKTEDNKFRLNVYISEAKYIDYSSCNSKSKESQKQLRDTQNRIEKAIFSIPKRLDQDLWLSRFSDLIINGIQFPPGMDINLSEWRHAVRSGQCEIFLRGYSHVFISGPSDSPECSDMTIVPNLSGGYQEIFSRAKLREILLAYLNDKDIMQLRRDNSAEDHWMSKEFRSPENSEEIILVDAEISEENEESPVNVTLPPTPCPEESLTTEERDSQTNSSPQQGDEVEWFNAVKRKCRVALQNFQLRSKLLDDECRLTPNCALLKFEGSSQLTVAQVLKKQEEFLTSYGLHVTSVRPEPGIVSISIARETRKVLHLDSAWSNWDKIGSDVNLDLLIGIKEDDNSPLILSPKKNAPHTLIAGSTGSGKSVLIQNIILNIIATNKPTEAELILIDPKKVSFNKFKKLPHLRSGIFKKQEEAAQFLEGLVDEMDRRYDLFEEHDVEDIYELKRKIDIDLPIIWVIHDEFALWMIDKEYKEVIESVVNKLAVAARAAGIFLIFAAQRPDKDVMPMQLRANLGNRLVLKVDGAATSEISSGEKNLGAEKLLGNGHLIAKIEGHHVPIYAQVPYATPEKINEIVAGVTKCYESNV